jgi:hypothetical protein
VDQPSKIIGRDPERPCVPRANDLAFSSESKESVGMSGARGRPSLPWYQNLGRYIQIPRI